MLLLFFCTLIPSAFFIYYLYHRKSVKKMPAYFLAVSFFSGIVCVIPIILTENLFHKFLDSLLFPHSFLYLFLYNFIVIALTEEFWKVLAVYIIIQKQPFFQCHFNGVICGVFAALGFASFENLLYIFNFGFTAAVLRTFTAIPSHMIFGLLCGYFLCEAKIIHENTGNFFLKRRYLFYAVIIPSIAHGIYDFSLSLKSDFFACVFLVYILTVEIFAFKHIRCAGKHKNLL